MTYDLTKGSISKGIRNMAIPLITASFVQMAYTLTDIIWLGRLGSEHVAAVGAAGFFIWLCNALSLTTKVGAEVTISQSLGSRDNKRALNYANHVILLSSALALLYLFFIFIFSPNLIGIFNLERSISEDAILYLRLIVPGLFFTFSSNTFSGIYNGQGNSKTPFKIVAIGLICNIVLDPIFIFGVGPIPAMSTAGAAVATVIAQAVVFSIFIYKLFLRKSSIDRIHPFSEIEWTYILRIFKIGIPVTLQNGSFALFSMTLATIAAKWGYVGVAVQSIGSQIEAITWMTATGFSTALAAFTGQNYGARDFTRIKQGYRYTLKLALSVSIFATVIFLLFGNQLFSLFAREPETISAGGIYLKILALSQIFTALEIVSAGSFNGCGKTTPPAIVGIILTGARIPMAYLLITFPALGLNGIWWSITISSILKGAILATWLHFFFQKLFYRNQFKHLIHNT